MRNKCCISISVLVNCSCQLFLCWEYYQHSRRYEKVFASLKYRWLNIGIHPCTVIYRGLTYKGSNVRYMGYKKAHYLAKLQASLIICALLMFEINWKWNNNTSNICVLYISHNIWEHTKIQTTVGIFCHYQCLNQSTNDVNKYISVTLILFKYPPPPHIYY